MIRFALSLLTVFLVTSPLAWGEAPKPVPAPTLEDLDAIFMEAGSVHAFVANTPTANAIRARYESALTQYLGGSFSRESFDKILEQLSHALKEAPELDERLMETTDLGHDVEIEAPFAISGLELKQTAWKEYLANWIASLEAQASGAHARPVLISAAQKIAEFEDLNATSSAAEKSRKQSQLYADLKTSEMKAAAARAMLDLLRADVIMHLLESNDADIVLATLSWLRSGRAFGPGEWLPAGPVRALIGNLTVPKIETPKLDVKNNEPIENALFRVAVFVSKEGIKYPSGAYDATTYRVRPLPRRFHGIWKGIGLHECVGGCEYNLQSLMPARWATVAIQGTRFLHVERRGRYLGFVQVVPVGDGTKTFGTIDFGSPAMTNKIVLIDRDTGKYTISRLWERLIGGWGHDGTLAGIVLSQTGAMVNTTVPQMIKDSPAYLKGKVVGESNQFNVRDPLAQKLVAQSAEVAASDELARKYFGRMITDATMPDSGHLTELKFDLGCVERLLVRHGP